MILIYIFNGLLTYFAIMYVLMLKKGRTSYSKEFDTIAKNLASQSIFRQVITIL